MEVSNMKNNNITTVKENNGYRVGDEVIVTLPDATALTKAVITGFTTIGFFAVNDPESEPTSHSGEWFAWSVAKVCKR